MVTLMNGVLMTLAIRARLPRLARLPEDAWEADRLLLEVRDLFQVFKTTEARHVTLALSDAHFPFGTVQGELAALRRGFSFHLRNLATAEPYVLRERRELLKVALLSEQAPLTSAEDLVAIRVARSERRLAAV